MFRNWKKQVEESKLTNKTPSFFKAAFATFGWQYMAYGAILFFLEMVVR